MSVEEQPYPEVDEGSNPDRKKSKTEVSFICVMCGERLYQYCAYSRTCGKCLLYGWMERLDCIKLKLL